MKEMGIREAVPILEIIAKEHLTAAGGALIIMKRDALLMQLVLSDTIGSTQHVLVCVSLSGSAFHPGSLFRGSGNGNGGVGQLVDHRGPLCL